MRLSVFIVGGGPVGLAMALLFGRFGIDCVIAEKSPTTTDHPKSRGCLVRTMELFRQWGIEAAIRARGLPHNADVFTFVESVNGKEYGRSGLSQIWDRHRPGNVSSHRMRSRRKY
jgi:putative polyketide hydroxylase/tetracenomycin A2 monooxygenase-dioxygenase